MKRPSLVDGLSVEEFIRRNADPIWLHQNEMWEEIGILEETEMLGEIELFEGDEIALNEDKMLEELGMLEED